MAEPMRTMMNNADDIPQSERRKVIENDRKVHATYHSVAQSAVDEDRGGRFAYSGSSTTVVGSSPVSYPQQPTGSPWAKDECPPEPPLGFSVDAMEPVGEPHQRTASATSSPVTARAQAGDDVRRVRRRGIRRI